MLKQRILTASVLAIVVVWVVLKLPVAGFSLALLAVILPAAWEWARLAGLGGTRDRLLYGGAVLLAIAAFWPLAGRSGFVAGLLIAVVACWCYAVVWMWR